MMKHCYINPLARQVIHLDEMYPFETRASLDQLKGNLSFDREIHSWLIHPDPILKDKPKRVLKEVINRAIKADLADKRSWFYYEDENGVDYEKAFPIVIEQLRKQVNGEE